MVGLRLFSVLAQAAVIVVAGLMARELGGSRLAQVTAALAVAFSPLPLFSGTEFQYTSFDFLWWVLIAYFTIRLLKSEDPRWWLAIGAAIGLGLLTKYSIVFYIAGILAGLVLTPARRFLRAAGSGPASPSRSSSSCPTSSGSSATTSSPTTSSSTSTRAMCAKAAPRASYGQFLICANLAAAPLWLAGLCRLPAQPPLPHAGLHVPGPAGALLASARAATTTWPRPIPCCSPWARSSASAGSHSLPRWGRRTIETVYFAAFAFVSALRLR